MYNLSPPTHIHTYLHPPRLFFPKHEIHVHTAARKENGGEMANLPPKKLNRLRSAMYLGCDALRWVTLTDL